MRSGSLRNKITFQSLTQTKSTTGALQESWTDLVTNPLEKAQIIPLKGDEKYMSKHLKTEVNHKIRLRYRDDLNTQMRILYGARIFHIDAMLNLYERNRELNIMATEVLDA